MELILGSHQGGSFDAHFAYELRHSPPEREEYVRQSQRLIQLLQANADATRHFVTFRLGIHPYFTERDVWYHHEARVMVWLGTFGADIEYRSKRDFEGDDPWDTCYTKWMAHSVEEAAELTEKALQIAKRDLPILRGQ